jgi:hypothetical protein
LVCSEATSVATVCQVSWLQRHHCMAPGVRGCVYRVPEAAAWHLPQCAQPSQGKQGWMRGCLGARLPRCCLCMCACHARKGHLLWSKSPLTEKQATIQAGVMRHPTSAIPARCRRARARGSHKPQPRRLAGLLNTSYTIQQAMHVRAYHPALHAQPRQQRYGICFGR